MRQPSGKSLRALALCATSLSVAGVASAQLAPIVVTATRTDSSPFEIPASIDRVGSEQIRDGKPQINISESLAGVPGLQARDRQNYAQDVQLSMRGFGARSTFGIRGLRLYVDGIPATFPDGQGQISNVELGSVDHIEVLRGPFSALYGNSSGGVVSIFTEDGSGPPKVEFGISGGSNGQRRESIKLSGSTGAEGNSAGGLSYVISASHFETDGYRDHSAAERNLANVKLSWKPDEDSRLTLVANTVRLPEAQDPLGLTRAQYSLDPRAVDPSANQFNTRKTVDQTQLGLTYERRIDSSNTLRVLVYSGRRSTTQYQAIPVASQTSALNPGGMIDLGSTYTGTDVRWTFRNTLGDKPYTVVAGVAYDKLDQHRTGFQNFIGTGASQVLGVQGALRRDEDDNAWNFDQYLQASMQLSEAWSLNAGLRHSSVHFDSQDHYIVGANGDDSGSVKYGATLPVIGVDYAVNDATRLYATAGKGFETPTFNELAYQPSGATGLNFGLQPARSKSLELGVKTRLQGIGDLNVAVFDTRTSNEIVTLTNVAGRSTYQNAGSTSRKGLEASWTKVYADKLRAQVAYTYLDAAHRNSFVTCNASPCPVASQQTIPSGNRIPGTARQSLYMAAAWAPPLGWRGGIDGRFLSKVEVNDANSDAAASYFVVGANLGYVAQFGPWKLTGFVRGDNLLARRYAGSVIVNEGNGRYFEPAPGRTWFAGVSSVLSF